MTRNQDSPDDGVSRRSVLAAGAVGSSLALSGCIDRVQSVVDQDSDEQLSLSITTLPADTDREGVQVARRLSDNLDAVGIDTSLHMRSRSELLEAVLLDGEFDLYVGRHPGALDPDFLYETLHSSYAYEAGWQNPFGFTNLTFDDLLEDQRAANGEDRPEAVADTLEALATEQPFVPVCVPDEYRLARTDRSIDGWRGHLASRTGYLGTDPESTEDVAERRVLLTDARPTQSLNPLSPMRHERGTVLDLVYDSLAVPAGLGGGSGATDSDATHATGVGFEPWLAKSWTWDDGTLTVDLREDVRFHDAADLDGENDADGDDDDVDKDAAGDVANETDDRSDVDGAASDDEAGSETDVEAPRRLTASDVEFTYEFLADTTRGYDPLAAPQYRGPVSIVDDVTATAAETVEFDVSASRAVAERALTVPILPQHVWHERVREGINDRLDPDGEFTTAVDEWGVLTTENVPPVGSGPFRFVERSDGDSLTLERFDDHFSIGDDALPEPTVETLEFEVELSSAGAIDGVMSGDADVTGSMLETHTIDRLPDDDEADAEDVTVLQEPSWTFYHVGFNTQAPPLGNPNVRRAVAQLVDKAWIAEDVFHGHASPVSAPVADEWVPDRLAWDGEDPETPFLGRDGDLDVEVARDVFADVGFSYGDDGRLLVR